jgi:hypothetical protein
MDNSKPALTYEGWVRQFVNNLFLHFDIVGWEVGIEFATSPSEKHGGNAYASIEVEPTYQMAVIKCFPAAKEDFDTGKIEDMVQRFTHEVVHVFLSPFQEFIEPHLSEVTAPYFMRILEQQTQKLTMVLLKTLPKNLIP